MSSKKLNPFKDFHSNQIQRSSRKIFTAHYACRNAALNLTPVTGTTNGFIFQIINSLIESWGVRLTWFDCNTALIPIFHCTIILFCLQWQSKYPKHRQVQFAHRASRNPDELEWVSEDEQLPVGWIHRSWPCRWRTRIMGIMGCQQ